jgi:hypothetical protein
MSEIELDDTMYSKNKGTIIIYNIIFINDDFKLSKSYLLFGWTFFVKGSKYNKIYLIHSKELASRIPIKSIPKKLNTFIRCFLYTIIINSFILITKK